MGAAAISKGKQSKFITIKVKKNVILIKNAIVFISGNKHDWTTNNVSWEVAGEMKHQKDYKRTPLFAEKIPL